MFGLPLYQGTLASRKEESSLDPGPPPPLPADDHVVPLATFSIRSIFELRVIKVLLVDKVNLLLSALAPASWTFLVLAHLVDYIAAKLILFNDPWHEPIPVKTEEMEAVEALIDPDEVDP